MISYVVLKNNSWAIALLDVLWWQTSLVPDQLIALDLYCAQSDPRNLKSLGGLTIRTNMPRADCFACHIPEVQEVWNCLSFMASQTCMPRTGVTDTQDTMGTKHGLTLSYSC